MMRRELESTGALFLVGALVVTLAGLRVFVRAINRWPGSKPDPLIRKLAAIQLRSSVGYDLLALGIGFAAMVPELIKLLPDLLLRPTTKK